MILILNKSRDVINIEFVNRVVHEYFSCIDGEFMTAREVSELFRHCICVVLGLSTQITPRFSELAKLVVNHLRVLKGWPSFSSEHDKCSCLEIFVHAMEAARGGVIA